MIALRVTDANGMVIVDSFKNNNLTIESYKEHKNSRYLFEYFSLGSFEILLINEARIANSNKVFKSFSDSIKVVLESSIAQNKEKAQEIADDYLHNVVKIHGNQKSIVERCVFGAEGRESYIDYIRAVKEKIVANPDTFAEDICALSKEVRLIDYHIGGYNLLRDTSSRISITANHNLKIFLLGLSHLFFDAFTKNNVVLDLYGVNEFFLCSFEYETFNIAMHSFFENAVKYSKPYSKIKIYTSKNSRELVFEMESIRIEKDEISKIYDRGFSGRCVPEDLKGSGIGMYLFKKALDRSKISFFISPNYSKKSEINNIKYTENTFSFSFSEN